jgi:hypothetical protein
MAGEPSYPGDAAVGAGAGKPAHPGEPQAAGRKTGEQKTEDGSAETSRRTRQMVAGAAIGIGSAAIVAALLYANRSRKTERKLPATPIDTD